MYNSDSLAIKKVLIFIALIVVTGFVIHYPATSAFFYNDDFGVLERAAYRDTFSGILKSFIPHGQVFGSRPVGELYYFICYRLFDFNPKAFHLVSLSIHIVNAVLVFLIAKKISKNDVIALVSGLIFASHFSLNWEVMWSGAIFDLTAGLFFFSTFLLYLHRDGRHFLSPFHICSVISFIFALRSKEMAVTLPVVLFLYELLNTSFTKREIKKNLWQIVYILKKQGSYYVIVLIYIILTFKSSTGLPAEGHYAFKFDIYTLLDGARYYLNFLLLKPPFFNDIFYIVIIVPPIVSFVIKDKHLIFGFFYLFVTLLPVIFLSNHRYDIYLYIPIFGFSFFVANGIYCIANFFGKFGRSYGTIIKVAIVLFDRLRFNFGTSYSTIIKVAIVSGFLISYGYVDYLRLCFAQDWLRTAARNYERCIDQLKNLHPTLPHGAQLCFLDLPISFIEFPHWEKIAYNDPSLRVVSVNDRDFMRALINENDNFYVFKYTKRKLMDISNFYRKGMSNPYNSPPYIELTRLFDKAERKTPHPNTIYFDPYCTIGFEQYSAIVFGARAKITFDIELPENPILETAIAVPQNLWNACDGVNFTVAINHSCGCGDEVIFKKHIDPMHNKSDRRWHDVEVDLSSFSNQKVRLVLYCEPVGDNTTDWADWTAWADPVVIANPNK